MIILCKFSYPVLHPVNIVLSWVNMDYETSPTMRYDGTGEVPADENHSEKNGSSGSDGSEGFVKGEFWIVVLICLQVNVGIYQKN